MRNKLSKLFLAAITCFIISCGNNKKSSEQDVTKNENIAVQKQEQTNGNAADSSLSDVKQAIENGLSEWIRSFKDFSFDSFRMSQKRNFDWTDTDGPEDPAEFLQLFKGSLVYSPDSSQYIDLYSGNIWLEKKGKKIVAIADADQTIILSNPKAKVWKGILFFGPSAAIEEAVWASPTEFILAGVFANDDGFSTPILLVGDINTRAFRWFESNIIRPKTSKFQPSGLVKLKIDEWE